MNSLTQISKDSTLVLDRYIDNYQYPPISSIPASKWYSSKYLQLLGNPITLGVAILDTEKTEKTEKKTRDASTQTENISDEYVVIERSK
jgi:hypothetical protein